MMVVRVQGEQVTRTRIRLGHYPADPFDLRSWQIQESQRQVAFQPQSTSCSHPISTMALTFKELFATGLAHAIFYAPVDQVR
jgi:hypothetical protein